MASGVVPHQDAPDGQRDVAYPFAVDRAGDAGAVLFGFGRREWRCVAHVFRCQGEAWTEYHEHDNTTSPTPFERPMTSANSSVGGIDWHSNGPLLGNERDGWIHSYFGIALTTTARLVVTPEGGSPRDLAITLWNGAYVAAVAARSSTLTAYDAKGQQIDAVTYPTEGPPEPPLTRWRVTRIRPAADGLERRTLEQFREEGLWPDDIDIVAYELWDVGIDAAERSSWLAPVDGRIGVGSVVEEGGSWAASASGPDADTPDVMACAALTPVSG